jgi:hypothetical protein
MRRNGFQFTGNDLPWPGRSGAMTRKPSLARIGMISWYCIEHEPAVWMQTSGTPWPMWS